MAIMCLSLVQGRVKKAENSLEELKVNNNVVLTMSESVNIYKSHAIILC